MHYLKTGANTYNMYLCYTQKHFKNKSREIPGKTASILHMYIFFFIFFHNLVGRGVCGFCNLSLKRSQQKSANFCNWKISRTRQRTRLSYCERFNYKDGEIEIL